MFGALFASTVTTVAIFIPIMFFEDVEGQLFADLALTSPADYYKEGEGSLMQCVLTPADRFMKMATSEVDGPPLRDFLDTPDIMRIFFVDGAKEKKEWKPLLVLSSALVLLVPNSEFSENAVEA